MKKLRYLFLLIVLPSAMMAQLCEPDTGFTEPGIHPSDSALPEATVNAYYEHVLTIIVPEKQDTNGITILVDSIELYGTIGVPSWLSLECIDTCIFESADTGCAVLHGTPPGSAADTTYDMGFITKAYLRFSFAPNNPFEQYDTVDNFWKLKVNGITGIAQQAVKPELEVLVAPSKMLHLTGALPPGNTTKLELYSLAGQKLLTRPLPGNGTIDHTLALKHFRAGLYIAVVTSANGTVARKFVIP